MAKTNAAVIGVGTTDFSSIYNEKDPFRTEYGLGMEALDLAVADAGISKDEIDGVLLSRIPSYELFCSAAGLRYPRAVNTYEGAGRMAGVVLQHAAALIDAGLATTVACVYGNNGRSAGATYGGEGGPGGAYNARGNDIKFDAAYGMTSPGAYVSMMYRRYMHEYGVPDGALAPIALSNRANAQKNPIAVMQKDLSLEDYMSSRYIAEPLRLYDYCMINDGGAAIIVTSAERARDTKQPVVRMVATEGSGDLTRHYTKEDFFRASSEDVATRLRESSGIRPADVDCVQIYDNFTPIVLFSLEHFGFAPAGEGWKYIQDGRIDLHGELPINTSGGHTSEGYMQGWGLQVEAVRQLRGDLGARQVADARTSQYICVSPIVTSTIFQRED
jgi:acetyl-CoA acetyltransferase